MSKKKCLQCDGKQVIINGEDGSTPCPALSVTVLGRLACKLPDGTFDNKAEHRSVLNARMQKDKAYHERNQAISSLARAVIELGGKAGTKITKIAGWNPEWFNCVYIDLPYGMRYDGLGGNDNFVVRTRERNPLKGAEMGEFVISECDKDLLTVKWYPMPSSGGVVYWKRQPHLEEPTGFLHRVIAKRIWGDIVDEFEVDHIDRDPSNCTRSNLRLATPKGNKMNQKRMLTSLTTGVKKQQDGKWTAVIGMGRRVQIGTFDTEDEARKAYDEHYQERLVEAQRVGDFVYPPLTVSWHYHDSEKDLFSWLPPYAGSWDGHDNPEKYRRLHVWATGKEPPAKEEEELTE